MKNVVLTSAASLLIASGALAQSPVSDNFNDGLGSQWTVEVIGSGPAKGDFESAEGGAEVIDGQLHITNNGWDVWEDDDGMTFVYQEVTGDFDVVLHVISFDGNLDGDPDAANNTPPNGGNEWEKAGIVFRQGLTEFAPYVGSQISRSHGLRAQFRLNFGDGTDRARRGDDGSGPKAGWWTRLVRTGDVFQILTAESAEGPWLEPDDNLDRGLPDNTLVINDDDSLDPPVLGVFYTPHSTDNTEVLTGTGIVDSFFNFDEIPADTAVVNWEIMN